MSQPVNAHASSFPPAELDRRFYAFTLDRLIAWTLDAMAAVAAYHFLIGRGQVWAGVGAILAVVLVVGLGFSLLLGLRGTSPGKAAVGLRLVHHDSGVPIGMGPALLRSLVLGVSALPTFGLGVATLAWTAVMDRGRQRRGWHDHVAHSIVVDVRPVPVETEQEAAAPRQIVNLTAMRLVPAPQQAPVAAPARAPRASGPPTSGPPPSGPPPTVPAAATPVVVSSAAPPTAPPVAPPPARRQPLGPPLTDQPPATAPSPSPAQPPAPAPARAPSPAQPPAGPAPAGPPAAPPPRHSAAERTVIRNATEGRRALARWRVSFDSGETFVVEGLALVGRRPEPRPGEPVRHLVPLRSGDMSLSKTHAQFQVAPDGVLVVMDRGSTNGSILIRQGVSRALTAGKAATLLDGDRVRFGDREMSITRES
ncbi:hypothetical protein GCM10009844_03460 [Nocardioides koreensis]|uniref:FHA domain-containing protein n=1 Tax=Nocardioides koreensis TaxID=433651 RepID=A0ABN2Z520_9ACTN